VIAVLGVRVDERGDEVLSLRLDVGTDAVGRHALGSGQRGQILPDGLHERLDRIVQQRAHDNSPGPRSQPDGR